MHIIVSTCRASSIVGPITGDGSDTRKVGVRIFSGAGLDVQWSGGSYLGVQWSGHVRRGFGGADDVAKRLSD